jgi:hypothetical protein
VLCLGAVGLGEHQLVQYLGSPSIVGGLEDTFALGEDLSAPSRSTNRFAESTGGCGCGNESFVPPEPGREAGGVAHVSDVAAITRALSAYEQPVRLVGTYRAVGYCNHAPADPLAPKDHTMSLDRTRAKSA